MLKKITKKTFFRGLTALFLISTIIGSIWISTNWFCIREKFKNYPTLPDNLIDLLGNVTSSEKYQYQAKDNLGKSLDCLNIIEIEPKKYYGVYHSWNGTSFNVNLVNSTNLIEWTFICELIKEASMPIIEKIPNSQGIIVLHEKWQNPFNNGPCWIKAHYYSNLENLILNNPTRSVQTNKSFSDFEGTPNIYNITDNGNKISVGFHYLSSDRDIVNKDHDLVAKAELNNLVQGTPTWTAEKVVDYNKKLICNGADGHIGGRKYGTISNHNINLQEAMMDSTDWGSWKIWIYDWNAENFQLLPIITHGGSQSFTNPHFRIITDPENPSKDVIFISYFIQGSKSASGEAGELFFYKSI